MRGERLGEGGEKGERGIAVFCQPAMEWGRSADWGCREEEEMAEERGRLCGVGAEDGSSRPLGSCWLPGVGWGSGLETGEI